MAQKFANAARGLLASGINDSTTTIEITEGGSLFPVANGTDWFKAVLQDETGIEIVTVTGHTAGSNTFTVTRGQEGTTARSFALGSVFGQRVTAGDMEDRATLTDTQTLTNKTLTDPKITLGGTNGTAGQVPVSQGAGLAPVWAAVAGVISDYQEFTSSGTWNKPSGATWVYVEAIGGGGSGGAGSSSSSGGGGGGFNSKVFRASDLSSPVTVTIGAGGASVTVANGLGGGDSSFGSSLIAHGGKGAATFAKGGDGGGGERGASGNTAPLNAAISGFSSGGGGSGGSDYRIGGKSTKGGGGGGGFVSSVGGAGGVSIDAGSGGAGAVNGTSNGSAGSYPGGGGGGANTAYSSGAGANGRVRVWSW
jgi:hypothetical protein